MSHAMYPSVFDEFKEKQAEYGKASNKCFSAMQYLELTNMLLRGFSAALFGYSDISNRHESWSRIDSLH